MEPSAPVRAIVVADIVAFFLPARPSAEASAAVFPAHSRPVQWGLQIPASVGGGAQKVVAQASGGPSPAEPAKADMIPLL